MELLKDAEFWVGIALLIFIGLLVTKIGRAHV